MEKMINVPVTEQELDLLIAGLGELPAKMAFNLIGKMARIKNENAVPAPPTPPGGSPESSPGASPDRP